MAKVLIFIAAIAFLAVSTNCQSLNEIEEDVKKGIQGLNETEIRQEDVERVEKLWKEKCEKNNADPKIVDEIKNQKEAIQQCMDKIVNMQVLQEELEKAKKTGSMDEIFGKYCNKFPEFNECFQTVMNKTAQCMDENEKRTLNITMNLVKELKEFVCYKDGDRIAMFVAEHGVECIESRKDYIHKCLNNTAKVAIGDPEDISVTSLPVFAFNEKNCQHLNEIRDCFVHELEKCKETTPANIVDAFFKFVKKQSPCKEYLLKSAGAEPATHRSQEGSGASSLLAIWPLLVASTVYIFVF